VLCFSGVRGFISLIMLVGGIAGIGFAHGGGVGLAFCLVG